MTLARLGYIRRQYQVPHGRIPQSEDQPRTQRGA